MAASERRFRRARAGVLSALIVIGLGLAVVGYQAPPLPFVASTCSTGPAAVYASSGYVPHPVDPLPYARTTSSVVALDDPAHTIGPDGVRVQPWEGHADGIYHPVNTAMYALHQVESYRATGEEAHLARAVANGQVLLDGASRDPGGALWFGYAFEHRLHDDDDLAMAPPWYSGMAQGQALALFVRLHQETGDPQWATAAHETFRSFAADHSLGEPHFHLASPNGCLWFEEYVDDRVPALHVVNGHLYAVFGLYDYATAFGDPLAVELFDAGATTIRESFDSFRVPGRASLYCASEYCARTRWTPRSYHRGVAAQLDHLAEMTQDTEFARMAQVLRADDDG